VVEDVEVNQRLLAAMLRRAGAHVDLASDGRSGLDAVLAAEARGEPYDLVLMDMQMPILDGYEATRALRAAGFARPIVALTAHAMSTDRDKCLAAGCTDYETKPIQRQRVIATCRRLLANAAPAPLPAPAPARQEVPRG
jgi:CheY-like chemotaxis protein